MSNPEINRIRQDLTRARERVAQIRAGTRGVRPPEDWRAETTLNMPAGGLAYSAQLRAQEQAVERLELELLMAIIPQHGAGKILELLEGKPRDTGASNASNSTPSICD